MLYRHTITDRQAAHALSEVFARADLDGTGALRRQEYDLLLLRTDGEACDDDTWQYMTGGLSLGFRWVWLMKTRDLFGPQGPADAGCVPGHVYPGW